MDVEKKYAEDMRDNKNVSKVKDRVYQLLVLLSGSDYEILEKCTESERKKHAMYGAFVATPALLALFAMTYAISTITGSDKWYIYMPSGLMWSLVVLFFDRFLVATYRKVSDKNDRKEVVKRFVTLLMRILFAAFVGVVVGHPLVLLIFNDTIEQHFADVQAKSEKQISGVYDNKYNKMKTEIDSLLVRKSELETLLSNETIGSKYTGINRNTTGKAGYGPIAKGIENNIKELNTRIETLEREYSDKENELKKREVLDLKKYDDSRSSDYLSRVQALDEIEREDGSPVKVTRWFIMLFFIFVDILPITWKALTKPGLYDQYLELGDSDLGEKLKVDRYRSEKKRDSDMKNIENAYKNENGNNVEKLKREGDELFASFNEKNLRLLNLLYATERYDELVQLFDNKNVPLDEVKKIIQNILQEHLYDKK